MINTDYFEFLIIIVFLTVDVIMSGSRVRFLLDAYDFFSK